MALYELTAAKISPLELTTLGQHQLLERRDLQRLLRDNISLLGLDLLVIAEEFSDWSDSSRSGDLLAVDRNANLVVIELKRDSRGGHMELQALRYAAMVAAMTFDQAVATLAAHERSSTPQALEHLLHYLDWTSPQEELFARDVRIVLALAAEEFSRELTTLVLWLNERQVDITCIRLQPYQHGSAILLDVQQLIPLPEAAEYQVRMREKAEIQRVASRREATGYWFMNVGDKYSTERALHRRWEDNQRYAFLAAGPHLYAPTVARSRARRRLRLPMPVGVQPDKTSSFDRHHPAGRPPLVHR